MKIIVNSKEIETKATNIGELAIEMELPQKGVAIAVGNSMIPRSGWDTTLLTEGSNLIIIKAVCGG